MPEVQIEPGKWWNSTDEFLSHIKRDDLDEVGDYLRRRKLLLGSSPSAVWAKRWKRRRRQPAHILCPHCLKSHERWQGVCDECGGRVR